MKFLAAAAAALFAMVQADKPSPEYLAKFGVDTATSFASEDMKLTDKQMGCFFVEGAPNCTSTQRTGFDKSISQWSQYFNPRAGKFMIPMLVQTNTYPKSYRKTAWKSFLWARDHFAQNTNIDLQFIDDYEKEIFFNKGFLTPFYGGGCWSFVGDVTETYRWTKVGQKMDIGWCHKVPGSIVHETMHALGFVHEHSRPDRDNYLNVNSRDTVNCGKYIPGQLDLSGLDYDFGSIMHYGEGACGISVKRAYRGKRIGQREKLSENDKKGINDLYAKTGPKFARD